MTKSFGQALTENVLIGLCVAVVSIAALSMLGGNLRDVFFAMMPAPKAKPVQMASSNASSTAAPATSSSPATPATSLSPAGVGVVLTTKNGNTITLDSYPQDVPTLVATAGANGATDILSDTLTNLANQLLQAGEISQPQYNALVNLANQGHAVAAKDKQLEDIAASFTTVPDMFIKIAEIAAKPQSIKEGPGLAFLGYNLGYIGAGNNIRSKSFLLDPTNADGPTQPFLQSYQAALASGALSDPATQQVVATLTEQIALLSEGVAFGIEKLATGNVRSSEFSGLAASPLINQKSASICTIGGATDSGVACK